MENSKEDKPFKDIYPQIWDLCKSAGMGDYPGSGLENIIHYLSQQLPKNEKTPTTPSTIEQGQPNEDRVVKPPIGLIPEWRFRELRIDEINEAMERYRQNNYSIPDEWIHERSEHLLWLKTHLPTSPYIQSKQGQQGDGWISVGDGFPKDCKEVYACNQYGKQFVLWYDGERWIEQVEAYHKSHKWPITHWRPTVAPPIK